MSHEGLNYRLLGREVRAHTLWMGEALRNLVMRHARISSALGPLGAKCPPSGPMRERGRPLGHLLFCLMALIRDPIY